jgi:hypothetical protein
MKRLVSLLTALAFVLVSAVGVMAQGVSTPTAAPATTMETVNYIDESGNPIATFTVTNIERNWQDYEEFYDPEAGNEYVRVTINAESMVARGTLSLNASSFLLQDTDGFIAQGYPVPSKTPVAEDDFSVTGYIDIQGGQQAELVLTFQVLSGVQLEGLYFTPDFYTRLVTLARFDAP